MHFTRLFSATRTIFLQYFLHYVEAFRLATKTEHHPLQPKFISMYNYSCPSQSGVFRSFEKKSEKRNKTKKTKKGQSWGSLTIIYLCKEFRYLCNEINALMCKQTKWRKSLTCITCLRSRKCYAETERVVTGFLHFTTLPSITLCYNVTIILFSTIVLKLE